MRPGRLGTERPSLRSGPATDVHTRPDPTGHHVDPARPSDVVWSGCRDRGFRTGRPTDRLGAPGQFPSSLAPGRRQGRADRPAGLRRRGATTAAKGGRGPIPGRVRPHGAVRMGPSARSSPFTASPTPSEAAASPGPEQAAGHQERFAQPGLTGEPSLPSGPDRTGLEAFPARVVKTRAPRRGIGSREPVRRRQIHRPSSEARPAEDARSTPPVSRTF